MYHAALIYAPASPEMEAISKKIIGKLPRNRVEAVRKAARDAAIPDIAAADLVLLGSAAQRGDAVHEDFAEIFRALKGISLAGRTVGIYALDSESTIRAFADALKDCEVSLPSPNRLVLKTPDPAEQDISRWLSGLLQHLEARREDA
jgi:flavodoxin